MLIVLPTELIIKIFKYLPLRDLLTLRLTCQRFNAIITDGIDLLVKNTFLATNQLSTEMQARSQSILNTWDKLRITKNWKYPRCKLNNIYKHKSRDECHPRIVLKKDVVYFNAGRFVRAYEKNGSSAESSILVESDEEIYTFAFKQDYLIGGLRDEGILIWSPKTRKQIRYYKDYPHITLKYSGLDMYDSFFSTCTSTCRLWQLDLEPAKEKKYLNLVYSFDLPDIYDTSTTTSFSHDGKHLFIGSFRSPPLASGSHRNGYVFDVESKSLVYQLEMREASVVTDSKWDTENIFYTCDVMGYLSRWDLRMKGRVQYWFEPYKLKAYCLDIDQYCTAITGTSNGKCILWDTRSNIYVQVYCITGNCEPVLSVAFDATHLYASTWSSINALDFSEPKPRYIL